MMQSCLLGSNTGLDKLTERSVQLHYFAVELQMIPFLSSMSPILIIFSVGQLDPGTPPV